MSESHTQNHTVSKDNVADSYDEVPYNSYPYPETHPNKLSSTAILFGMTPPPINCCRVLELGCGSGNNLIGMASELPDSAFTGVDLSKSEVALANAKIKGVGLKNIKITQMSITDIKKDFGKFDYIIAHGVYSWVPANVREHILCICRDNLAKNGVAYISYNTYPGWHAHEMLRNMMLYHIKDIKDPIASTQKARKFIKFLAESSKDETPYITFIKNEVERTKNLPDYYLYHDQLSEYNQPFYFYEFAKDIERHKLKYLRECDIQVSTSRNFSPELANLLNNMGDDIVAIEQHIDFFLDRTFRETMICHHDAKLNRLINKEDIVNLYFISTLHPKNSTTSLSPEVEESFTSKKCPEITTSDTVSKTLWVFLAMNIPKPLHVDTIHSGVVGLLKDSITNMSMLPSESELKDLVLTNLLWGISMGFILTYTWPGNVTLTISDKPVASALARYDAERGNHVINELHEIINIDNISHHILPLLDGSNDIESIIEKLLELAGDDKINIKKDEKPITDRDQLRPILKAQTEIILREFARTGILIG